MICEAVTALALAIYYEGRNQSVDGQRAIAEVVLNRVADPRFPDTICGVLSEDRGPKAHDCQFSYMCDGLPESPRDRTAYDTALRVAESAVQGDVLGHGADHYHATHVDPSWASHLTLVGQIGDHVFYIWD